MKKLMLLPILLVFYSFKIAPFEKNYEEYIDDIPFNTTEIFIKFKNNINNEKNIDLLKMKEEEYIDDIPFDTTEIFNNYNENLI